MLTNFKLWLARKLATQTMNLQDALTKDEREKLFAHIDDLNQKEKARK